MEQYEIPKGYLPGHKHENPKKEYVKLDTKKKVNPKDVFVGYKEVKKKKKKRY